MESRQSRARGQRESETLNVRYGSQADMGGGE